MVRPRHELRPPPGISAGELRDTGKQLMKGKHEGRDEGENIKAPFSCSWRPQMFPMCPQMSTLYAKILDRLEKARIKHGPRAMEE